MHGTPKGLRTIHPQFPVSTRFYPWSSLKGLTDAQEAWFDPGAFIGSLGPTNEKLLYGVLYCFWELRSKMSNSCKDTVAVAILAQDLGTFAPKH